MRKLTIKYIFYIVLGALLGILMQRMPLLKEQWGQNIFNYMATDFGIWAVICILIASYAESPLHSGLQCFLCMASMVASYYILVPQTFMANLRWVVVAILIFPIGIIIYSYRHKTWVMLLLELFFAGALTYDVLIFEEMLAPDYKMIVITEQNIHVFTDPTIFSVGNYVILMTCTVFGMLYTFYQYKQEKRSFVH